MTFDEPAHKGRLPDARRPLDEYDAGALQHDLAEHSVQGVELVLPPGEHRSVAVHRRERHGGALGLWLPDRRRSAHSARLVRFRPIAPDLPLDGRQDPRQPSPVAGSPGPTPSSLSRNCAASSARDPTPSLA